LGSRKREERGEDVSSAVRPIIGVKNKQRERQGVKKIGGGMKREPEKEREEGSEHEGKEPHI